MRRSWRAKRGHELGRREPNALFRRIIFPVLAVPGSQLTGSPATKWSMPLLWANARCKNHRMDAPDRQVKLRLTAVRQLSHVLDGSLPHEIVTLTSSTDPRTGNFTAMATRTGVRLGRLRPGG
jgi:hypothetical protein